MGTRSTWTASVGLLCLAANSGAATGFRVTFEPAVRPQPAIGRLVVYLTRDDSGPRADPADGPFFENPQPMFGIDVSDLAPGAAAIVGDDATSFPVPPSRLPPGSYRAQAVLDINRLDSSWRREPGNLFSDAVRFTVPETDAASKEAPGPTVDIPLTHAVVRRPLPDLPNVDLVEVRSDLLSKFRGRDVFLRAGVVKPAAYDPTRKYAAVYEVPGFGGDHTAAWSRRQPWNRADGGSPWGEVPKHAFYIVLDPEGPNGHTLFADSANNGPCGRALVEELIPAIEAKYPLVARPEARVLRGHSSGGWATLWLALTYPDTFGACWSTSPDPVDFRRFQAVDIYSRAGMYGLLAADFPTPPLTSDTPDTPSMRSEGRTTMTIRQENAMEEVIGPDNTSGQQWDSWMAVFGPRNARGNPAALYDPVTGTIDKAIAEAYRAYDIDARLHKDEDRLGPIFQQRIRLLVGDRDSFFLNEAVALLKPDVEKLSFPRYPEGRNGGIRILEGYDHGSIFGSPELRAIPSEMMEHLRRNNLAPKPG